MIQVDPEVLKELPRDIREQIESAMKRAKKNKQTKRPMTTRSQSSQQGGHSGRQGNRKQDGGVSNSKQTGYYGDSEQNGFHGNRENSGNSDLNKQSVAMVMDAGLYDDMVTSDGARPGCSNWGGFTSRSRSASRSVSSDSADSRDVPNNMLNCDRFEENPKTGRDGDPLRPSLYPDPMRPDQDNMFLCDTLDSGEVEGEIEDFTELTQIEPAQQCNVETMDHDGDDDEADVTGLTPPLRTISPIVGVSPQVRDSAQSSMSIKKEIYDLLS